LQAESAVDTLPCMYSRAIRIALLIVEALWLNVIVPGHQRGVVPLPGESCSACEVDNAVRKCCHTLATGSSAPAKQKPGGDPAQRCAICHFAARLCTPPVINFTPPRLGLAEILEPPAPRSALSVRVPLVLRDRAPPFTA
jgi:hypothetical protein